MKLGGRDWQDYALILVLIASMLLTFSLVSDFKALPGPVYGGDAYLYYGILNHFMEGGSFFASSQFLGEYAHYPWLYFLTASSFGLFLGLGTLKAAIYFPVLELILGGLLIYFLGYKIFESKTLALALVPYWLSLVFIPYLSSSIFNRLFGIPLAFLIFYFIDKKNGVLYSGVVYGLCGLIDPAAFLSVNLFLVFLFFYESLNNHVVFKEFSLRIKKASKIGQSFLTTIKKFALIYAIGVPIALLVWWAPIFHYKMNMLNPFISYVSKGTGPGAIFSGLWGIFRSIFFSFSTIQSSIFSVLAFAGVYATLKYENKYRILPWMVFFVSLVGFAHPLITEPLFGVSFAHYAFNYATPLAKALFIFFGLYLIGDLLNKKVSIKGIKQYFYTGLIIIFFVIFIFHINDYGKSRWAMVGKSNSMDSLLDFAENVKEHTSVDDVILTMHPESGFAINALTGRKVVNYRRTHASPYVDMNKRNADSAIILYSNNSDLRKKLLEEYSVDFIYVDPYSLQTAGTCQSAWNELENQPDASYNCLRTSLEYETYLNENGLETKRVVARLDPASASAPTFEVLAIKPTNLKIQATQVLKEGSGGNYLLAAIITPE